MKQIPVGKNHTATVSDEDHHFISQFRWYPVEASNTTYARAQYNGKYVFMHRLIMGVAVDRANIEIDHIDHNGLNNTRNNLRVATRKQNRANSLKKQASATSKYKGVSKFANAKAWIAQIRIDGKKVHLGSFATEEKAAAAYNAAALQHFGQFAHLNQI